MKRYGSVLLGLSLIGLGSAASAQTVSPSLANVAFGSVSNASSDLINRQNTCSFTGVLPVNYSVTATGNGAGSAFTITNGTSNIPYEVQWAQTANAATGTNLVAGQPLNGQQTAAILSGLTCLLGITNATLIVVVRGTSLAQATAGSYTGNLTVILTAQ
jgi:hypothetical protein